MTAPPMETCQDIIDVLTDYMEMLLEPREGIALEHHLAGCTACSQYLETLRKTRDAVSGLRYDEIPAELRHRLRTFLDLRTGEPGKP